MATLPQLWIPRLDTILVVVWRGWIGLQSLAAVTAAEIPLGTVARTEPQAEFIIDSWQTDDGLPQNTILSMAQTPDGYLWLATFNGLARFDGMRFVVFNPVNTPELRSGRILEARVDRNGWLWIFSEEGHLTRLVNGRFEVMNGRLGLPNSLVVPKAMDPAGNLWLGRVNSLDMFRFTGEAFVPADYQETMSAASVNVVAGSQGGGVWLRNGKDFQLVAARNFRDHLRAQGLGVISLISSSRDGDVWILGDNELRKLHSQTSRAFAPGQSLGAGTALAEDHGSNIWLATWTQGLHVLRPGQTPERVPLAADGSAEAVRTLLLDNEDNLWVGTDVGGLYRVKPRLFRTYHRGDGLSHEVVKSVMEDREGNIWVLNGTGMDWIRRDGYVTNRFQERMLWSMSRNAEGQTWIGTFGGGVFHYRSNAFLPCWPVDSQRPQRVMALSADRRGNMWLGAPNGLWQLEGTNMHPVVLPAQLPSRDVRAIVDDAQGRLYLGLYGGGLLCRNGTNWTRYGRAAGLVDENVLCLYSDAEDAVWIGTVYGGLSRFKNGKVTSLRAPPDTIPNLISCILEDESGYFWLGGVEGIHRVQRQELNELAEGSRRKIFVHHYGKGDGLRTSECAYSMQPTACKGADGRLWFATINGVSMADPKSLTFNPHPPPVAIEEVLVNDRVMGRQSEIRNPKSEVITVPAGSQRLEIRYAGLSLTAPEKIRFRFRMEGLETDWVEAGTRRAAYYTHLPPRQYRFRVTACNNDGVWNEAGATLAITALPQFWQTGWFVSLMAIGAGGLVFGLFRWRIAQLHHAHAARAQFARQLIASQEQERQRIAGELHDGLGQNLLLIQNRAVLGLQEPGDPAHTTAQLNAISATALQSINDVRSIAYGLRPYELDRLGLTKAIEAIAQKVTAAAGLKLNLELEVIDDLLSPECEISLYRIVQECLNNIVRHARAASVSLRLHSEPGRLRLTVQDDGPGDFPRLDRPGPSSSGGLGLAGMAERVRIMDGDLTLDSEPNKGTTITILLPVPKR